MSMGREQSYYDEQARGGFADGLRAAEEERQVKVVAVHFSVQRPNEYTRWRPRIDRGVGFTAVHWWAFHLSWGYEVPTCQEEWDADAEARQEGVR